MQYEYYLDGSPKVCHTHVYGFGPFLLEASFSTVNLIGKNPSNTSHPSSRN